MANGVIRYNQPPVDLTRATTPAVNLRNVTTTTTPIRRVVTPSTRITPTTTTVSPTTKAQQIAAQTTAENAARAQAAGIVGVQPRIFTQPKIGNALVDDAVAAGLAYEENAYNQLITNAGGVGGTGGGARKLTPSELLAKQKFEYEKSQDTAAANAASAAAAQRAANLRAQYADIEKRLASGATDYQGLRDILTEQQGRSEQDIQAQYQNALNEIQRRQTTAQGLTTQGFDVLGQAIRNAPPGAFTAAERAVAPQMGTDTVAQFAQLSGVAPVAQAIQDVGAEVQAAAAGEVGAYNRALDFLAREEQSAQTSRALEADMARTLANAQLQVLYGGQTSGLEQQRLQALADVYNQIQAQRFNITQAELARKQQLQDAMNELLGAGAVDITSSGTGSTETTGTTTTGTTETTGTETTGTTTTGTSTKPTDKGQTATTSTRPTGTTGTTAPVTPPVTAPVTPPATVAPRTTADVAAQQRAEGIARLAAQRQQEEALKAAQVAAQQRAENEARLQAQRRAEIAAQQRAENEARAAAAQRAAQAAAQARIAEQQRAENAARAAAAQRAAAVTSASKPSSGSKATKR